MIQEARSTQGRLTQLDGLRFFAIFSVFLHHSLDVPMLWVGVDLFFVISGYLITAILLKLKARDDYFRTFYYRRLLRIFPPYYLFLLLAFMTVPGATRDLVPWYILYFNNFNDAFNIHDAPIALVRMWSLAIEEQFYLLWPFVVLWTTRHGLRRICLVVMLLAPLFRLMICDVLESYRPGYYLMVSRADLLAWGALLTILEIEGHWLMRRGLRSWMAFGLLCLMTFVVVVVTVPEFRAGKNNRIFNSLGYTLIAGGMASVVAVAVQLHAGMALRVLQFRPIAFLGMISYTMYLYHTIAIHWARRTMPSELLATFASAAVTILIGVVSWYAFEKPLLKFKDYRFRR